MGARPRTSGYLKDELCARMRDDVSSGSRADWILVSCGISPNARGYRPSLRFERHRSSQIHRPGIAPAATKRCVTTCSTPSAFIHLSATIIWGMAYVVHYDAETISGDLPWLTKLSACSMRYSSMCAQALWPQ